jgi:hypothetical protein
MDIQVSISDALTYSDARNYSVTFGWVRASSQTESYLYHDVTIAQAFKKILVSMKSTKPRTASVTNTASYTDILDTEITTEGTKVILVEILTNSSYRG